MSKKYYVVWQGVKPGIYDNWIEAKAQVEGRSDAQYMGFPSEQAATKAFAGGYRKAQLERAKAQGSSGAATTGQKSSPKTSKAKKAPSATSKMSLAADINIFCDGACSPNPGKAGTGIAVYHQDQPKVLWYGLYEAKGTNNSAELNGLLKAFQMADHYCKQGVSVQILSDSKYGIDCITKWAAGWRRKGWTRGEGEAIKNLDLIQACFQLYEQLKTQITITHVRGHANIEGNELADRMAVLARSQQQGEFIRYPQPIDVPKLLAMTAG